MNPKIEYGPIKIVMITRAWRPNLAFQYRTTAEHKRHMHAFHKFKNYREKVGLPVRFSGDPLAEDEIRFLRNELAGERDPWRKLLSLSHTLSTSLDAIKGEIQLLNATDGDEDDEIHAQL